MKNRIAELRKARGLTLQALADMVGASNQQISHLEKGRRGLTVDCCAGETGEPRGGRGSFTEAEGMMT